MVEQAQKLTGLPPVRDVINFARDKNLNKLIKLDTLLYANKVEKFAINFGIEMK
jgi:hypothetical protein